MMREKQRRYFNHPSPDGKTAVTGRRGGVMKRPAAGMKRRPQMAADITAQSRYDNPSR